MNQLEKNYPNNIEAITWQTNKKDTIMQNKQSMINVLVVEDDQDTASFITKGLNAVSYTHLTLPTICSV